MTAFEIAFAAMCSLGGAGGIVSFLYVRATRQKINAEARKLNIDGDDVLSGRAMSMLDKAIETADRAEAKAERCTNELNALRDHVDVLERMMRDAGITPPQFIWPLYTAGGNRD